MLPLSDELQLLHAAFQAFNDVVSNIEAGGNWETNKAKLTQLKADWVHNGLFGHHGLSLVEKHRQHINWEGMTPATFSRFYRFIFDLCREPCRRNIQTELAVEAWRLVLRGRFRLLDRWCCFVEAGQKSIITEDTWRQVLDFAQTIHEDLSNYDAAGAWAVLLDEFVDDMRSQRTSTSAGGAMQQGFLHAMPEGEGGPPAFGPGVLPGCGSKRKGPDVDIVAEQLSTMDVAHQQDAPVWAGGGGGAAAGHMMAADGMLPHPHHPHKRQYTARARHAHVHVAAAGHNPRHDAASGGVPMMGSP